MKITVVIPTIRQKSYQEFLAAWEELFRKHEVILITVFDGKNPRLEYFRYKKPQHGIYRGGNTGIFMEKDADLIYNFTDAVRNLGFAYVAKFLPEIEYIITLDDDTLPIGDPIQDHIDALNMRVPISWFSIASEYTRGFPYGVRDEAEVVFSHGVWNGVPDFDAPTQLIKGTPQLEFYKGSIPRGCYFAMSGMNVAFKRKLLPYMYWAPMGEKVGVDRFPDVWCGIQSKKIIDEKGWAVVTGYARIYHQRASNVWKNLQKEGVGLELNEVYWQGQEDHLYFKEYNEKRKRWEKLMIDLLDN